MRTEILYQPSFAVAKVFLELGEAVRAESGAMVSMSGSIDLEAKAHGGIGKVFGRILGGESIFQTTFTAVRGPGEVLLAPPAPGDILQVEVESIPLIVTSGCYLAGDTSLDMQTQASLKGFFGGEGLFMLRVGGPGSVLLSSFGSVHAVKLGLGEPYIVDTGHLVAFTDGMGYTLKKAPRGIVSTLTSGEGIIAEMQGPGIVYIQTRTPKGFGAWLGRFVPKSG